MVGNPVCVYDPCHGWCVYVPYLPWWYIVPAMVGTGTADTATAGSVVRVICSVRLERLYGTKYTHLVVKCTNLV